MELVSRGARQVAITSLSFPSNDVNKFIIGSQECAAYQVYMSLSLCVCAFICWCVCVPLSTGVCVCLYLLVCVCVPLSTGVCVCVGSASWE